MFLILDCWDNFEYFKLNPKGKNSSHSCRCRCGWWACGKIEKANDSGHADIAAREVGKLRVQMPHYPKNRW